MVENKPKNISIPSGGRSTYSDITSGQPKQGHGIGNCGRGDNNNQRPSNRGSQGGNHNPRKTKKSSFEEACVKLKGAMFDIGSEQTLLYNNSFDKILTYAGKNYTLCVRKSIKAMRDMSYHYNIKSTQTNKQRHCLDQLSQECNKLSSSKKLNTMSRRSDSTR